MQDALNYRDHLKTGNTFWAVTALPGSPSSTQITNYKNQLTSDIDVGYPLANNEYAAPGYGIGKQPGGEWIMHWFASNGYSSSGSTVVFADPGWGAARRAPTPCTTSSCPSAAAATCGDRSIPTGGAATSILGLAALLMLSACQRTLPISARPAPDADRDSLPPAPRLPPRRPQPPDPSWPPPMAPP